MMWMCLGLIMISGAAAQVYFLGGCPNVKVMTNFESQKYLGKWYEAERYYAFFEVDGRCITATYNSTASGTISVVNRQISILSGMKTSIQGYATQNTQEKAKLTIFFPSVGLNAPYWIIDTDYTTYSVVWSCSSFGFFSARYTWILTREQNPADAVLQKAYQALDKNNISRGYLMTTDQKNCPQDV